MDLASFHSTLSLFRSTRPLAELPLARVASPKNQKNFVPLIISRLKHFRMKLLPSVGGRPTKYTPPTVKLLCELVADGLSYKAACKGAGISEETFRQWRQDFPELVARIDAARELARREALRMIKAAGSKDWRASEAWLRLSFPEDYRIRPENIAAVQLSPGQSILSVEQLRELQERKRAIESATTKDVN